MTQEHSPLPWKMIPSGHVLNGRNLAITYEGEFFNPGDLAFAVKAVNSHDALVKALECFVYLFDIPNALDSAMAREKMHEAANFARATLAKAKSVAS